MHLHILGIGGTFMSGLALLAKECGYTVTGSDASIYPPMSTQLNQNKIAVKEGYRIDELPKGIDLFIVGNVIRRGNPLLEHILKNQLQFISGPQWLHDYILKNRWVIAIAGTHGKTTTSSMLAWVLEHAGKHPGYLIGGIPENFGRSARKGHGDLFVVEADEYDSAFFDKRAKFIHYWPKTVVLNNLEYDHADIYENLAAIKKQFHHLIKTIPTDGLIIGNAGDNDITDVLNQGVWSSVEKFGPDGKWKAVLQESDGSRFQVFSDGLMQGEVRWDLLGQHNVNNALAVVAAANHAGVEPGVAIEALASFKNVKRRLEIKGSPQNITIYDDFAHHPTAIQTTLQGLRAKIGQKARLVVVIEFGSYSMKKGIHKAHLLEALGDADMVVCKDTEMDWGLPTLLASLKKPNFLYPDVDSLVRNLKPELRSGDHVVIMSNSGFEGIHEKLIDAINGAESYAQR